MTLAKAVSLSDLRGKKQPVTRSIDIFLNSDVARAIAQAEATLDQAEERLRHRRNDVDLQLERDQAADELERLQQEAVESGAVVAFTFRSVGRKAYERLLEEHPPTEEQIKEAHEMGKAAGLTPQLSRPQFNADTFPPALVALASYEPKIAENEAYELFHVSPDWNEAELTALFVTARDAQQTRDVADLGKLRNGSRPTRG
ncbi:MAG TPA: hypothetical protein VK988_02585 [Acidimicrobiales bacterium]|nr:hypothetical protein [Acidimicrobiales bacterium]